MSFRAIAFGLLTIASPAAFSQRIDVNVQDERQRDSYMVGMDIAAGLKKGTVLDDVDVRIVAQTIIDILVDKKQPLLSEQDALITRKAFVAKEHAKVQRKKP